MLWCLREVSVYLGVCGCVCVVQLRAAEPGSGRGSGPWAQRCFRNHRPDSALPASGSSSGLGGASLRVSPRSECARDWLLALGSLLDP